MRKPHRTGRLNRHLRRRLFVGTPLFHEATARRFIVQGSKLVEVTNAPAKTEINPVWSTPVITAAGATIIAACIG